MKSANLKIDDFALRTDLRNSRNEPAENAAAGDCAGKRDAETGVG
jgi:hypothetical protein